MGLKIIFIGRPKVDFFFNCSIKLFFLVYVVYGVSDGIIIEEDPAQFNKAPLIIGGNFARPGEFRGKVSVTNNQHKIVRIK